MRPLLAVGMLLRTVGVALMLEPLALVLVAVVPTERGRCTGDVRHTLDGRESEVARGVDLVEEAPLAEMGRKAARLHVDNNTSHESRGQHKGRFGIAVYSGELGDS
jgi:hypothetical protein